MIESLLVAVIILLLPQFIKAIDDIKWMAIEYKETKRHREEQIKYRN